MYLADLKALPTAQQERVKKHSAGKSSPQNWNEEFWKWGRGRQQQGGSSCKGTSCPGRRPEISPWDPPCCKERLVPWSPYAWWGIHRYVQMHGKDKNAICKTTRNSVSGLLRFFFFWGGRWLNSEVCETEAHWVCSVPILSFSSLLQIITPDCEWMLTLP